LTLLLHLQVQVQQPLFKVKLFTKNIIKLSVKSLVETPGFSIKYVLVTGGK